MLKKNKQTTKKIHVLIHSEQQRQIAAAQEGFLHLIIHTLLSVDQRPREKQMFGFWEKLSVNCSRSRQGAELRERENL